MAIRDRNPAEVQVVAPVSTAQSPPRQIARDAQPGAGREGATTVPIEGVSARLLARMNESLAVPTATSFREIDVAVVWAQEEPRNMGARKFVLPKLRDIVPSAVPIVDVSRPERSSPAEGSHTAHRAEQARIVEETLIGSEGASD